MHRGKDAVTGAAACRNPFTPVTNSLPADPADDSTDPAAVHTFAHLLASIVLSRKRAAEAHTERQRLMAEAQEAAEGLYAKRRKGVLNEMPSLHKAIHRRTPEEVFAIVRRTLADLADSALEQRMGEVLARRRGELDGPARELRRKSLTSAAVTRRGAQRL